MLLASLSGAVPRHEAVISPVRVNLAAGELSRWLPADYSLVLRSSWPSPAVHDAGEKWTMTPHTHTHTPPHPSKFQVNAGESLCCKGVRGRERLKKEQRKRGRTGRRACNTLARVSWTCFYINWQNSGWYVVI